MVNKNVMSRIIKVINGLNVMKKSCERVIIKIGNHNVANEE